MSTASAGAAPTTMRALRWRAPLTVVLERVPVPEPADDQALVAVHWTGLCGSDVEEYLQGPVVIHPPVTLGHEIVGEVAVAARDRSGPPVGTPVVVDVVTGCGHCYWCSRHDEGLCPELVVTGQHTDGGLADFVLARAARLVPVPPGLRLDHAALAEPAAVAVRAVRRLGAATGRGAVVIGGGTVGLLVAQVLHNAGAAPVVVLEPGDSRRAVARDLGLHALWAPDADQRRAALMPMYPWQGVDLVVECSGASGMAAEGLRLLRPGGTAVLLGITSEVQPFDQNDLVIGEKSVSGSAAHMWDDDVVVAVGQLASGAVQVGPLISRKVPLDDAAGAFAKLADPSEDVVKVLVDCRHRGSGDPV